MSFLSDEEKNECRKIFNYLDKNKDNKLNLNEVILGLGALGKICTVKEQKKIESKSRYYDLEDFINLCAEKISFKNLDYNLNKYFNLLESTDNPGYISGKNLSFILKKFNDKITDKDINDIIKEVGDGKNGYVNIEMLVKELLFK